MVLKTDGKDMVVEAETVALYLFGETLGMVLLCECQN